VTVLKKENRIYLLLVLPVVLYLVAFLVYPALYAVRMSFATSEGPSGATAFPSATNFQALAGDKLFWRAVANNVIIPVASVFIEIVAGLAVAVLLSQRFRLKGIARSVAILPFAIPEIVFLTIMKFIFSEHGYLNGLIHGLGGGTVAWLKPGSLLMLAPIILADAWHVTPIVFLILLSAIENIPQELFEAARIDGAGGWGVFRYVTLPLLMPALSCALVLRSVDAFRIFATPLVLGGFEGAPVLSTYAYHCWADRNNAFMASAASVVLAVVILCFSYLYLKMWRKSEAIET